ncbi:reverse transcriptase domain-containing protein [Tanacetum coccineum]
MDKDDEEKTAFHTSQGVYCYTKMPFGLKNAGATYQRLVDNAFEGQVGRNLEVYVDDLVIKSHTEDELVRDIVETFRALRKINMKLNPKKCSYQVSRSHYPLLKHSEVHEEGRLPLDYGSRRSFHAAQAAYKGSTSHASRTPTRGGVDYRNGEADPGVSIRRQKTERYSKAPNSGKSQKSTHQTGYKSSKTDASVHLATVSVLLGEHNISYRPRTAVKGQILADFLIEKPETDAVLPQSEVKLQEPWILFTDGSSCVDGSGAGLILTNPEGMEFTYALRFEFTATNNEAEYEALIAGLRIAARMGVRNLEANVDSRLVANHVLGEYVAKEDNMIQYLDKTKSLIQGFDRFTLGSS